MLEKSRTFKEFLSAATKPAKLRRQTNYLSSRNISLCKKNKSRLEPNPWALSSMSVTATYKKAGFVPAGFEPHAFAFSCRFVTYTAYAPMFD